MSEGFRYQLREVLWNESLHTAVLTIHISLLRLQLELQYKVTRLPCAARVSIVRKSEAHKRKNGAGTFQQDSSRLQHSWMLSRWYALERGTRLALTTWDAHKMQRDDAKTNKQKCFEMQIPFSPTNRSHTLDCWQCCHGWVLLFT